MDVPPWKGRRAVEARERVRRWGRSQGLPCCLCREPIDYDLLYPDPMSCSVQHDPPRSLRPDLTWNPEAWFPAHLICNKRAGDRPQPGRHLDVGLAVY